MREEAEGTAGGEITVAPAIQRQSRPQPQLVRKREPEITWAYYPRIEPGEYSAISEKARVYFDKCFKRHVCCVRFAVLDEGRTSVLARLPWFLNLGSGPQPRAGRRSRYWQEWVRAKGVHSPARPDRLSPRIFEKRAARVFVDDTRRNFRGDADFEGYSVVRGVLTWETC